MLDLDCHVREVGGVTLVGAIVESSAPTPRRVRIESTLDGPVWPPRRDGVPERGWDGDRFEGVVPAGGRLALGFASPAAPTEPPLFVVDHERAREAAETYSAGGPATATPEGVAVHERTPTGVLRALGSPRPPRDAVPDPVDPVASGPGDGVDPVASEPGGGPVASGPDVASDDRVTAGSGEKRGLPTAVGELPSGGPAPLDGVSGPRPPAVGLPDGVADWLSTVERRIRRAEALADACRVTTAAGALERAGGLDGARRLAGTLERDERVLRAVARRARRLADRSAGADVPLSTLERLA